MTASLAGMQLLSSGESASGTTQSHGILRMRSNTITQITGCNAQTLTSPTALKLYHGATSHAAVMPPSETQAGDVYTALWLENTTPLRPKCCGGFVFPLF